MLLGIRSCQPGLPATSHGNRESSVGLTRHGRPLEHDNWDVGFGEGLRRHRRARCGLEPTAGGVGWIVNLAIHRAYSYGSSHSSTTEPMSFATPTAGLSTAILARCSRRTPPGKLSRRSSRCLPPAVHLWVTCLAEWTLAPTNHDHGPSSLPVFAYPFALGFRSHL